MFRQIGIVALSAFLGLGTLAAIPAVAQADGFYFSFGHKNPHYGTPRGHSRYYRHHRPRHAAACTPRSAIHKAYRMGLRHARVADVGRRAIRVSGVRHHRRASIVFARAPHCPVIRAL
ncbi:hypothetical protein [Chelativorans salis]|uniref:Antifreeze protein n=1 Tax=Chelativorans salis TaxID=2978478 RepID=A0ABT2LK04_9HYPH|nr:hypothetical protein [Chelativorans sp. EGI FJ00035]MCT7374931.1 hypothetical protein [Chelativorans sp. EGI FJ00035]